MTWKSRAIAGQDIPEIYTRVAWDVTAKIPERWGDVPKRAFSVIPCDIDAEYFAGLSLGAAKQGDEVLVEIFGSSAPPLLKEQV